MSLIKKAYLSRNIHEWCLGDLGESSLHFIARLSLAS
jgi:hypothetical protein